ncbi:MAG: MDR family MFS transporter [Corynebacterium sp.]|nr:MDR family MFS transporter [Corynebacterium sp.]
MIFAVTDKPTPESTPNPTPEVSEKQAWRALTALCVGFFMILLDQTIVAVATPNLLTELHADLNQVVWVTSIYLLFFAVPLLVTGRLGDRYGQRNIYLIGMVIFTLSSLACGLSPNIESLIVARAVQGIGASLITPQTMSVLNRIFPRDKRGSAMGAWGVVAGLASFTGPILGGFLVGAAGWESIFFINVPFGILSIIMVWFMVPDLPKLARSLDAMSVLVSIIAMSAVVFTIQQGPDLGWPWWLWVVLVIGLVLVAVFIKLQATAQRRKTEALVPLDLFSIKNFSLGTISITAMGFAVGGTLIPVMLFLQGSHHFTAEQAGLFMVPMALCSGLLSPFVGRMSDTVNPRILSITGFSFMMVGTVVFVVVMRDGVSVWWLLLPIVLIGIGNGFVWSPNSSTSLRDVPIAQMGAASGVYNATRQVGSVVGAAMVGAAMQIGAIYTSTTTAMGNSLIPVAIALVVGLIAVSKFEFKPYMRESSHS